MSEPATSQLAALADAMSHRLATPARIVSGNVRILHERLGGRDAQADAALAALDRGARRIDAIVDGLTRYARAADRPLELAPVDAADEMRSAVDGLADEIAAAGAVVAIGPLPVLHAEPRALRALFRCLLENAIAARGEGVPRIAVTCAEQPAACLLRIDDDGVGVPAGERARVFEPFVSIGHGRAAAGAGLGLTLARHIVERHGGEIRLDARPGGGTSVHVALPRANPADEDAR